MNIESASSSANTDIMEQNRPLKRSINSVLNTSQNNGKKMKMFNLIEAKQNQYISINIKSEMKNEKCQ